MRAHHLFDGATKLLVGHGLARELISESLDGYADGPDQGLTDSFVDDPLQDVPSSHATTLAWALRRQEGDEQTDREEDQDESEHQHDQAP